MTEAGPPAVAVDFAALFEGLPTAYLIMSPDLTIVEVNSAYCALLDRRRDDLLGRYVFDVFPPAPDALDEDGRNPLQTSFERARDSRRADPLTLFTYAVTDPATGRSVQRHWSLIAAPLLDADGATSLVVQRVEDVSDYVRASRAAGLGTTPDGTPVGAVHRPAAERSTSDDDTRWRARTARVEAELYARVQNLQAARTAEHAATRAAHRATSQQAALVAVARALGQADSEDDVLAIVADRGLTLLDASASGLCLRAADGAGVRILTTDGVPGDLRAQFLHLPADLQLPVVQTAVTGEPHYLVDRHETLRRFPEAEAIVTTMGLQAQASAPLLARGRLLGSLTMGFTRPRSWPQVEVDLVEAFATLTAQALERLAARDAEQAATRQQATLVALAGALAQTETEADVFAAVARQSLGLLGAFGSGMCLREPDGTGVYTLATDTLSSEVRATLQHLPADYPMPLVDTAVSGTPHFLVDRAEAAARFSAAGEHYATGGVEASAQVALRARGKLLGSLSLAFAEARPWPAEDRAVVEAFAGLVAQALERIYSHDAEVTASTEVARFSETLQRSLLTSPPEPDHLHIAVRYSPAAHEAQVGGDWYDAFITAGGSTSLVIGDVTGHDRTAAAAMGQLRNLLRGIAYAIGDPPAAILTTLDRAAHDLAVDTTATLVLARIEQTPDQRRSGERLMRWSNAGHLPPLLIDPHGKVSYLQTPPDLLLGVVPGVARHDHEVVLAPGSTVLFYTDGLVERRHATLQQGLDWLASTTAGLANIPVDELCDALLALVGEQVEDDVALLALRAYPEDQPRPPEAGPNLDPRREPASAGPTATDLQATPAPR